MLKVLDFKGNFDDIAVKFSSRKADISKQVNDSVNDILEDVKKNGDKALMKYCRKFDGFMIDNPKDFVVTKQEILDGVSEVGKDFMRILERTKQQITEFHKNQVDKSWSMYKGNGVMMGQLVRGLEKVALYVPGGTATYPSTVLMNAVPAIAGVAMGTNTLPKVDKIVGPGNIYVATAKKNCYGMVDIDMVAGPSEILIVADEKANPKYIAADLMSQAEHDKLASAILVTTSSSLVEKVNQELIRQLSYLSRTDIIKESIENYGGAIIVESLKEAFEVSNYLAPEHLEVLVENPMNILLSLWEIICQEQTMFFQQVAQQNFIVLWEFMTL